MNKTKLLLLALAGLIMTGCVIREGGGGYYGGGYGGYEQRGYYSQRGDYVQPNACPLIVFLPLPYSFKDMQWSGGG